MSKKRSVGRLISEAGKDNEKTKVRKSKLEIIQSGLLCIDYRLTEINVQVYKERMKMMYNELVETQKLLTVTFCSLMRLL